MSFDRNDPAYPVDGRSINQDGCSGLTKREAYIKAALEGLTSNPYCLENYTEEVIVDKAFRLAKLACDRLEAENAT